MLFEGVRGASRGFKGPKEGFLGFRGFRASGVQGNLRVDLTSEMK